jgi:two-component system sensor histidine kinase KdpD
MQTSATARPRDYLLASTACAAVTMIAFPFASMLDHANVIMLYLLVVALIAMRMGRGPAVLAAAASVLLFDFFFVEPRFSLAVADAQYLITFAVMLAVALIIGALTARLRQEAMVAVERESTARALYELARELSGAIAAEQVATMLDRFASAQFAAKGTLLLPDASGMVHAVAADKDQALTDFAVPQRVFEQGMALPFVDRQRGATALALPLEAPLRIRGVLVIHSREHDSPVPQAGRPLLDAVASLVALVVERLHFVEVARQAVLDVESERLRNSLLSAVSHDLRTPLTVLFGMGDALTRADPPLPPPQEEAAAVIREQSLRLSHMVENLLEMARLQAGRIVPRKEWQPLEEVIGSSLKSVERQLGEGRVVIDLPADLPVLEFDAVLVERVFANLLDNAIKYAPGSEIVIRARKGVDMVEVTILDHGPGVPAGAEARIFDLFERGTTAHEARGTGIGLAICRAIVEAHGGSIRACNGADGGACFCFTLPLGTPPALDDRSLVQPTPIQSAAARGGRE